MTARVPATPLATPEAHLAVGIGCIAASVLLFAVYNALVKWLAAGYPPAQIMFFRGLFGLLPFAAYALIVHGPPGLRSRQPSLQVLRACFGLGANLLFILAYRQMPLAEAVAIGYAAPIFIVVLSVPLLSERVGIQRASAAIIGFIGVLMIAQPGVGVIAPGAFYAMGGTLCYALLIIATRRLGASDPALCTVIYSSGIYAFACALAMPALWVTPGAIDLALLSGLGVIGSSAMLLFAHAYRHAPAAVLAPFDYTAMIWAGLLGFAIWGEVPGMAAVAGMAVIAASGLFLMRHERLRQFRQDKP